MTSEGDRLGKRERDTRWEDSRGRQAGMTGEGETSYRITGAGYKMGGREREASCGMTGEGDKLGRRARDTRWEDGRGRQAGRTGEGGKTGGRKEGGKLG